MKTTHKKASSKSKILKHITLFAVFLCLIIAGMYVYHTGPFSISPIVNNQNTDNSNSASNGTAPTSTTDNSKTPTNNQTTNSPTANQTVNASITYINQTDTSLRIGTLIDEITSAGTCTLTLTKGDKIISQTVDIQALASSSTCKGFDTPIVSLSSGQWSVKIDIILTAKEAHLSESVTIK